MDPSSEDPAGRAADPSDTPAGMAHRTEWQHRTPESGDMLDVELNICSYLIYVICLYTTDKVCISICYCKCRSKVSTREPLTYQLYSIPVNLCQFS